MKNEKRKMFNKSEETEIRDVYREVIETLRVIRE